MNHLVKSGIIMIMIIAAIIGVFFFLLPMLGVPEMVGSSYWMISLGGSLALSIFLGYIIRKFWKD